MSPGPSRSDVKASLLPSGDQAGWLFVDPAFAERFMGSDPNRLAAWISTRLLRCDSKAMSSVTIGDEVGRGLPRPREVPSSPHAPAAPNKSTRARTQSTGLNFRLRANAIDNLLM